MQVDQRARGSSVRRNSRFRVGCRRRDPRLAQEAVSAVAEHQRALVCLAVELALLLERILHLEQVGEVGACFDAQLELDPFAGVIEEGEVFVDAVPDRAPADQREARIAVNGSPRRGEEELGGEVPISADGQHAGRAAVDRQAPAREVTRVAVENP